jgi:homoserine dehydrogenase
MIGYFIARYHLIWPQQNETRQSDCLSLTEHKQHPDFKVTHTYLHPSKMVTVGIVGVGLVGSELLAQLHATGTKLIKIVALTNSKRMVVSDSYSEISLADWKNKLAASTTEANISHLVQYLSKSPEHSIIIDCTSSDHIAAQYPSWLSAGLSIVTPNKKGFSGSLSLYEQITSLSNNLPGSTPGKGKPLVYHESTVGAGLPILNTLTDLVKTGDKVQKVEGIFSGTLSYIFNNFSTLSANAEKKNFSDIVKVAKELGYTEPDPRDDLNGMDVARKVKYAPRSVKS